LLGTIFLAGKDREKSGKSLATLSKLGLLGTIFLVDKDREKSEGWDGLFVE